MRKKLKTTTILLNLFKCVCVFYAAYYVVCSIIYAIYSLEGFDGTIPFNFNVWIDFTRCCNYTREEMVNTLSMVVSFPISGAVFGVLIDSWVWDYAITVSILHVPLSSLVMLSFPTNWTWWVCLGISWFLMTSCGESVALVRRKRNQARLVVPEVQQTQASYLDR